MVKKWMMVGFLAVMGSVVACTPYTRTVLPINPEGVDVRVPAQQLTVADAVDNAIEQLSFKSSKDAELVGKTCRVEVCGVFPHTNRELLDYVQLGVERKLAKAGALIYYPKKNVEVEGCATKEKLEVAPEGVNYVVKVGVSAAGADIYYRQSPLVAYIADWALRALIIGFAFDRFGRETWNYEGYASIHVSVFPAKAADNTGGAIAYDQVVNTKVKGVKGDYRVERTIGDDYNPRVFKDSMSEKGSDYFGVLNSRGYLDKLPNMDPKKNHEDVR